MTLSDMSPTPVTRHDFQAAEIWLLLQALGAVDPGLEIPAEVAANQAEVDTARAGLIQHGILQVDSTGEVSVAPEIEVLVRPSAFPYTVFVASVADKARQGKPTRMACFSLTPDAAVINWVDESNRHHYEGYDPQDFEACLWTHLTHLCDLEVKDPDPAQDNVGEADVQRYLEEMKQMVVLMAMSDVQSGEPIERAIGWFVSNGSAWIMAPNPTGEQVAPTRASRADIARTVSDLVQQAVPQPEPSL
jgi:hypothetical protein